MSEFFRELIFPVKPKIESVVSLSIINVSNNDHIGISILDTIWCTPKRMWISMAECVDCDIGTKTIEEILQDDAGCD